jgi:hypothetical protein
MAQAIFLHFGQPGWQIGIALWQALMQEWGIDALGNYNNKHDVNPDTFFYQNEDGLYVPRAVFLDLDGWDMDRVRIHSSLKLLGEDQFVSTNEDGSSTFSKGYYTTGEDLCVSAIDSIRSQIEKCDNLDWVFILHSTTGGTGSGFTSKILNQNNFNFSDVKKIMISLFPPFYKPFRSTAIYNLGLWFYSMTEDSDMIICYDNECLTKFWTQVLKIDDPSLDDLNVVIVQSLVSILNTFYTNPCDLSNESAYSEQWWRKPSELITTMVPFPKLKYCLPSMSFVWKTQIEKEGEKSESFQKKTLPNLLNKTLDTDFSLVHNQPDLMQIPQNSKYSDSVFAMHSWVRGNVDQSNIVEVYSEIKETINFSEFCSKNLTINSIPKPWFDIETFSKNYTGKFVCQTPELMASTLQNTTSFSLNLNHFKILCHDMEHKRAYISSLINEGMSPRELSDWIFDMDALEKVYQNFEDLDLSENGN